MIDKVQKIREEVERLKEIAEYNISHSKMDRSAWMRQASVCTNLLSFIDSMQKEPVIEIDFEQELYKYFGQVKDFTLGMRIAKRFYEIGRNYQESVSDNFEAEVKKLWEEINTGHNYSIVDSYNQFYGLCVDIAEWQKQKDSIPVSEDLDKEIDNAHKLFYEEVGWDSCEGARAYVADWFAHYFANWQKEQLMAKAVDATVHIDAGGYPYIPQIELYDYEKDISLAKEGDKYKVILIKEESL